MRTIVQKLMALWVLLVMCVPAVRADWTTAGSYTDGMGFAITHTPTLDEPYIEWRYPSYDKYGVDDYLRHGRFYVGYSETGFNTWRNNPSNTFSNPPADCQGTYVSYFWKGHWDVYDRYETSWGVVQEVGEVKSGDKASILMRFYPSNKWSASMLNNFFVRMTGYWNIDDNDKSGYWLGENPSNPTKLTDGAVGNNFSNKAGGDGIIRFCRGAMPSFNTEELQFVRTKSGKVVCSGSGLSAVNSKWWAAMAVTDKATAKNAGFTYGNTYMDVSINDGKIADTELKGTFDDTKNYTVYYHKYLRRAENIGSPWKQGKPETVQVDQTVDGSLRSFVIKGNQYPSNITFSADKWAGKIKLSWTNNNRSTDYNTNGIYYIYRKSESESIYTKIGEAAASATSYTDADVSVGVKYEYAVTFKPTTYEEISEPINSKLTAKNSITIAKTFTFSQISTSSTTKNGGGVVISWTPEKRGVTTSLERFNTSTNNWEAIYEGTATSYTDKNVVTFGEYQYRLKTNCWDTEFVSAEFSITYMEMSSVTEVTASQGSYNNLVKVSWTAEQFGTADTRYVVSRKLMNDPKSVYADIYETLGTATNYYYEDQTAQPGHYYYYKVEAYAKNPNTGKWVSGSSKETDGFNTARGIISGRVSYGSGTAVEGVTVRLSKNTDEDDSTPQFYSLYSKNESGVCNWTPSKNTVDNYLANHPYSIQLWVNPDDNASLSNKYRSMFTIGGRVTISLKGAAQELTVHIKTPEKSIVNTGLKVKTGVYTNICMTADSIGNYHVYVVGYKGNDDVQHYTMNGKGVNWNDSTILKVGGDGMVNDIYLGNIDDVRVWSKQLTESEILKNYKRILAGTEAGLLCYWPLDEGAENIPFVYDYSKTNGVANGNHATKMSDAGVSTTVPTNDQLSLYGLTDGQGNYTIRGVPFTGEGTSYTIEPLMGIHSFSPKYLTRYVSNTSLTHNSTDFEDISSFPVSGKVLYSNTNIPVEGAYIYVDGTLACRNNDPVQTDAEGNYSVDVPIGDHYVSVVKDGHVFEGGGRYPQDPNGNGQTATFESEMTGLTFYDATTVTVAGRVAGGDIQYALPLGLKQSKANIGQAKIVLDFANSDKYYINAEKIVNESSVSYEKNAAQRDFEAATTNVGSTAYVEGNANLVTIYTDATTGEFAAQLPPLQYTAKSIIIPTQLDIDFSKNLPVIDATNVTKTYKDSVLVDEKEEKYNYFEYVASALVEYKSAVHLDVEEGGDGIFGEQAFELTNVSNQTETVTLYTVDEQSGQVDYTFGYPVYIQRNSYVYSLHGYEEYTNYDDPDNVETSQVPLVNAPVTIQNQFASEASVKTDGTFVSVEDNTFELDSLGRARYKFKAGMPNIQVPYTRGLAITYEVDGVKYSWEHNNDFEVVVLGCLPTGNNFVTKGPDKVAMILRDPPGTASSSTYTQGTTITTASTITVTASEQVGFDLTTSFGTEAAVINGVTISNVSNKFQLDFGISETYNYEDNSTVSHTVSMSEDVSTSDGSDFVGAVGDVFIGASTNITLGQSNDVVIMKNEKTGAYSLGVKKNLMASQEYGTRFNYTANYIENVLLPNLQEARDSLIVPVAKVEDVARPQWGEPIYVTNLPKTDKYFGTSNDDECWGSKAKKWDQSQAAILQSTGRWNGPSYSIILPEGYTDNFSNLVEWYNSSLALWERQLYNNEKAKVDAITSRSKYFDKNYSFDAGASVTSTVETTNSTEYSRTDAFEIEVMFGEGWDAEAGGTGAHTGYDFHLEEHVVSGGAWNHTTSKDSTIVVSYTLAEDGDDDYLSVDVYKAPDQFGPIFYTRAGATCAPFEDAIVTKYYKPGTVISQRTLQIEKCELTILDQSVTGVPSGKETTVRVLLRNLSETGEDGYYGLWVNPESNPDGLQVYMDGMSIVSGVDVLIPAGDEPLQKTLVIKQSNTDILDYENISLSLYSTSQPDDTGVFPGIYSDQEFSVYFQPSNSDVDLHASAALVNTESIEPLMLSIDGYDYNRTIMQRIRLQYKGLNDANYVTLKEYVKDADMAASNNNLGLIVPLNGSNALNFSLDLRESTYSDQTYLFRAQTVGLLNGKEVTCESAEVKVIRDMSRPQLLTTPTPTNGVLGYGDNITLTFNEDINRGALSDTKNFDVTAVLNESRVAHDVALSLTGNGTAKTEATINLAGKSFSADFWLKYSHDGVILQHGSTGNKFVAAIESGKLVLTVGKKKVTSVTTLPANKWLYLAISYDNSGNQPVVAAGYGQDASSTELITPTVVGAYEGNGPLCLGGNGLEAYMQELTLWNVARTLTDALVDKDYTKNQYTSNLIGYWQMNEGHGTVAADRSRNRNLTVAGENAWYLNAGVNYAVKLDGATPVIVPANAAILSSESYLVETWFSADADNKAEASILSYGTNGRLDIRLSKKGALEVGQNGIYTTAYEAKNLFDGQWHHLALSVLKSTNGSAILYLDGKAVRQFSASAMPNISGGFVAGARKDMTDTATSYSQMLKGAFDELRLWKGRRTAEVINNNMYARVRNDAEGLVAYYPMESRALDANNQVVTSKSNADMAGAGSALRTVSGNSESELADSWFTTEVQSMAEAAAQENVQFNFVASERQLTINLVESPYKIENCTVNLTAKHIVDVNGNEMNPVSWVVYVNQNQLRWSESEIAVEKKGTNATQFTVDITNNGAASESWAITGLPSWLSVNAESGTLAPLASLTLTFTVDQSAAIGNYEQTIYLTGSQNINAPLTVDLTVVGEAPQWEAVPGEQTMNVVAQLSVDGVLSSDVEDMVGAFVGNTCVGVAKPVYFSRYDAYYLLMNIYEPESESRDIVYKVYDASTGIVYPGVDLSDVNAGTFVADKLVGSFAEPVILTPTDKIEQDLSTSRVAWKWISFYALPDDCSPAGIFHDLNGEVGLIKSMSETSIFENGWHGNLAAVSADKAYKIKVAAAFEETVIGTSAKNDEVDVKLNANGWSWIGYPMQASNSLANAFADAQPEDGDIVKSQSAFAIYNSGDWVGSLVAMEPGAGYLYYSGAAANKSFHFASVNGAQKAPEARRQAVAVQLPELSAESNMTLVACVMDGDELVENAVVTIYKEQTEVPCNTAVEIEGRTFVTVGGETGDRMNVMITTERGSFFLADQLQFAADARLGSMEEPYVFQLQSANSIGNLQMSDVEQIACYNLEGELISVVKKPTSVFNAEELKRQSPDIYLVQITFTDGHTATLKLTQKVTK